ncbi:hypothetical protein F5144DRAFT_613547 [Chaetomium tenue]|uniref:Uncharacterized protein n=1 Tax=Chaetomium tenue TaxID=1854479 RepID=A0ACB7P3E3_9PEZI|nr:hypothetical protein F5144DRAFT_613547 [Chaetomium globosum]
MDGVFPGVRKHQSAGSSMNDTSAQPYRQVTRPWASRRPTQCVVNVSNDQEMTTMDRWVSQNIKDEMWNHIYGVYGAYGQQDGVGVVEGGTVRSEEAVQGSETVLSRQWIKSH